MVVRVSPSGTQPVMWLGLSTLVFQVAVAGWCLRAVARQEDDYRQGSMRFCATAIHDVRQPLQAATLFLDGLTHAQPGPHTLKATQGLEQSILSVRHILDDFHDLARLDAAAVGIHMQNFNLAAMLHALEAEFAAQANSKNLRFCFYCPSTDIRVHSDPQWVQTIVRKLLIHAMAQTQHGGVLLGLRQRAGQVLVQVWDTRTRVQPVNDSRSDRGLTIAARGAQLIQSPLIFSSKIGGGAVCTLPLARDSVHILSPTAEVQK